MIKIFRKIRQRLLYENLTMKESGETKGEGTVGRYLLYAFGEVILVVIGILIALQINNWNENRINKIVEKNLLMSILENLQEDEATLEQATERFTLTLQNIRRIFHPAPIPDDSLAYIATRAGGTSEFIPITTAFDRSMSSAEFDLIRNDSISKNIQRLYAFDYKTLEGIHEDLSVFQGYLKDLSTAYDAFDLVETDRNEGFYDQSYLLPWNLENLKKRNASSEYRALIKQLYLNVSTILQFYHNIQTKNRYVQKHIQSYLTSF